MKKKNFLFLSLLFLFSLLFSSVFVNSENSFALDDLVITSSTSNLDITSANYTYFYIESSSPSYSTYQVFLSVTDYSINEQGRWSFYPMSSLLVGAIRSNFKIRGVSIPSQLSGTITVTFSNNLPSSLVPSSPTGNLDISENGTYDVTSYATATVNVENEVIYGDYHNDLITINNSILTCGAICLVIYFFYCIYRIIIKNSGVK